MMKVLLKVNASDVERYLLDGFAVDDMNQSMFLHLRVQKGFTYERTGC